MDILDAAQLIEESERARVVANYKKHVPDDCECGEPVTILSNGARCRFCADCLADWQREHP